MSLPRMWSSGSPQANPLDFTSTLSLSLSSYDGSLTLIV